MHSTSPLKPVSTELQELLKDFKTRKLKNQSTLSYPEDSDNRVFYVASGRLRVYLCYGDKVFTLALLNPGDIYCTHTRAYVQAIEESQVYVCDLHTFSQRLQYHPQLSRVVTRVLSTTLAGCIDTIENLAFRDVRARFCCFLLSQLGNEDELQLIRLPLSIELLAQSIGTSRQTLSSLISDMHKAGIVERQGKGLLRVLKLNSLKEAALL